MPNIHHHCSNSLVLFEPAVLTTRLQYAQLFNTMHFINFMEFAVFKNFEVLSFFLISIQIAFDKFAIFKNFEIVL